MCLSCGCNQPEQSHGDSRNITTAKLADAKKAGGRRNLKHTASTIHRTLKRRK